MIKEVTTRTLMCDRCKKEVSQFESGFKVSFPVRSWDGSAWASDDRKVDLCTQCTEELKKFLDDKDVETNDTIRNSEKKIKD